MTKTAGILKEHGIVTSNFSFNKQPKKPIMENKPTKEEQRIFESALIVVASAFGAGLITLLAILFSKI